MTDATLLLEEAADWADRLDTLSPDARVELRAWLDRSGAHREALSRMVRLLGDPALFAAIEQAEITTSPPPPRLRSRAWSRATPSRMPRRVMVGMAAALAVTVATPLVWRLAGPSASRVTQVYATATAEQRQVALPDGSDMTLDAASRIAIAFSDDARDLTLQQGAARFEVRHDATRPFAVSTPEGQMVALGTNFSVDRGAGTSELRVYRGRVRLTVPGQPAMVVTAGHWAEAGTGRIMLHDFEVGGYQGWQDRWLSGNGIRLGDAVARLERYSKQPIKLMDPGLAYERFNGRFRLDQPVESLTLIGALFDQPVSSDGSVIWFGRPSASYHRMPLRSQR
jgi:transmembrane sensor